MTPKWDYHFMLAALHKAGMSKDPSTQGENR